MTPAESQKEQPRSISIGCVSYRRYVFGSANGPVPDPVDRALNLAHVEEVDERDGVIFGIDAFRYTNSTSHHGYSLTRNCNAPNR